MFFFCFIMLKQVHFNPCLSILLLVPISLYSKPHLALGGVKNVSLNLTISNTGDDAYDTNIYFNFSREVFYINFWQKVCS